MPYRILITTHHITSRAKIQSLIRAAEAHRVSAVLKTTIKPPGVMICEGDVESDARAWLAFVRTRRYKGLRFMKGEDVAGPRTVNDGKDGVKITEGTEGFVEELQRLDRLGNQHEPLQEWWKRSMGFRASR